MYFSNRGFIRKLLCAGFQINVLFLLAFFGLQLQNKLFAAAPVIYAYDKTNKHLISFSADNPGVLLSDIQAIGLPDNEIILGMGFAPRTNFFFTLGGDSGANTFHFRGWYPRTGIGNGGDGTYYNLPGAAGEFFGFSFPPTGNQMRLVNNNGANYRINFSNVSIITNDAPLAYATGDPNFGTAPKIAHIANNNNLPGATVTTLYGYDYNLNKLVTIGGINGSPSPNDGQVFTVGSSGVTTSSPEGGFDIQPNTNKAYAALRVGGVSKLYTINLTTGAATLIGNIGSNTLIDGLAVSPVNPLRAADFEGDNKTDLSVFRPSNGQWWTQKSSNGENSVVQFGLSDDKIVTGDYTGDGKIDIAIWRPGSGEWYILRSEDYSYYAFPFGSNGDIPIAADLDGDYKTDAAVFRPSSGVWYIFNSSSGAITAQQFGQAGDIPVAADYDADGRADIAIFRPSTASWWVNRSYEGLISVQFGTSEDKPVPGDYDGDGKADYAFWRPLTGQWFIYRSENGGNVPFTFGLAGDLAAPGDYDGDGKLDAAIWRPSNGTWLVKKSTGGTLTQTFGLNGDLPVPTAFVP